MILKGISLENFNDYKKPSMFIAFPTCGFKCGRQVCQNSALETGNFIDIPINEIVNKYIGNNITHAIVCGGLEPLDTFEDLLNLIKGFRKKTNDDIVIYTGYYKEEIKDQIKEISQYSNIILKYGRFIPGQKKHFDNILGVKLASDNQYAERIS